LLHQALGKLRSHFHDHLVPLASEHLEQFVKIEGILDFHATVFAVGLENVGKIQNGSGMAAVTLFTHQIEELG
jgi:hypothetical protein